MASNSGWSKNVPSGSSSIAQGDDDIRSFKSTMQALWEQEHYFTDGSTNSAGIAKHGAGRAFVGTASQLSNPTADNDGRLFWTTDNKTLYVGQVSSSSWSAVADAITLDSAQTWTALQEFEDAKVTGSFSNVTSLTTNLVTAIGAAADDSGTSVLVNTASRFTYGDVMLVSASSVFGATSDYMLRAYIGSDPSFIVLQLRNHAAAGSRVTIPSGATIHILGFKTSGIVF